MRELQSEVIGDRRVRLLVGQAGHYSVTVEARGPSGAWQDISLQYDRNIRLREASAVFQLRCAEQEARALAWGE